MKKLIYRLCIILPAALTFGFLAWAFSRHGTIGLFRVNGQFRLLFIILGIAGIMLALLAIIRAWFSRRNHKIITRILTGLVIFFIIFDTVIPIGAFAFTGGTPSATLNNMQPQVLLGYGTGSYGIPNVMVVTYSKNHGSYSLDWGITDSTNVILEKSGFQHTFLLSDLLPDTGYWFRFGNDEKYYFRTPAIDKTEVHFVVGSDAHFGAGDNRSDLTEKMLRQIADSQNNYDYFFSLGDLVEYGFSNSMWQQAMQSYAANLSGIPSAMVVGNHDTLFSGLAHYEKYYRPEAPVSSNGSNLWYRVDAGRVHFLVLDVEWSAESYPEEQAAWLEKQFAEIPIDDWKIVMSHGFYYSSGYINNGWKWYDNPETIDRYTPLFEKYGVDIVFSGHNHQMELLQHAGVTYVICGAFGGLPDNEQTYISPASLWHTSGQYGFVDVSVNNSQATIVFRGPDNNMIKELIVTK